MSNRFDVSLLTKFVETVNSISLARFDYTYIHANSKINITITPLVQPKETELELTLCAEHNEVACWECLRECPFHTIHSAHGLHLRV